VAKLTKGYTPPCFICGKKWKRADTDSWCYHDSVGVVCRHHHGVYHWYQNLLMEA
jgi:hypothetical protein